MPETLPPAECANCGAAIPPTARTCPECGADERTGWRESDVYDGLNLPDHAFEDEFSPQRHAAGGTAWRWWAVAAVLLALLVLSAFVLD